MVLFDLLNKVSSFSCLLIQMLKEKEEENKKLTIQNQHLELQLIGNDYAQYQARPELYLIDKIQKHNPWPHKQIDQIVPFLQQISSLYNHIPYHNLTHAFDHLDLYLNQYGWQERLAVSQQKVTLMLIAAYAHDSGHQGLTNAYYKNSGHALSLASSSPLQYMHASNLSRLLQQNGLEVELKVKEELVEMILKTDNFYHHELTQSAKTLEGMSSEELRKPKNVLLVQCLLLHAADLNNTAKQTELTLLWTSRLYEQFQQQNKLEKQHHLPITCNLGSKQERVRSNISFLDHLAIPLFKCIAAIEPKFQEVIARIERNKDFYLSSAEKNNC